MTRIVEEPNEHSSWTASYLLAHCEGYRVESNEGELGYVEDVVCAPDGSAPLALRVRSAAGELRDITLISEGVVELHPNSELIVVRAPTGDAGGLAGAESISKPLAALAAASKGGPT